MARPRVFDIDKAIETAALSFWKNGYEQTSVADLTREMGISPPSFYFAFESKDGLFRKALGHYVATYLSFVPEAFKQPTARGVAEKILYGSVDLYTNPASPRGCLIVNCSLPCSESNIEIRKEIAAGRRAGLERLRKRFQEAKVNGDLQADADPAELARFVMTLRWGLAIEAQSGPGKRHLYRVVARGMQGWPT
jgi:AcrR family transcriptional regulator